MKDRLVKIDRSRHLLYSAAVKKVILERLHARYPDQKAEALWEKVQHTYADFLKTMPYSGGKANPQARGIYDSVALFAYYEAVPDKPTPEEFGQMNLDLFVPVYNKPGIADLNRPWMLRAANAIFKYIAKKSQKHQDSWPGNYHMEVLPFDPEAGIRYRFTTCPIADFAREHGYTSLMPALCNPDYPMLACMHGTLIRTTTCANGSCCDYRIVGDRCPDIKNHPLKRDKDGYLYNEPLSENQK